MSNEGEITDLQTYYAGLLSVLSLEYKERVEKWRPALRNVGSAFALAVKNFEAAVEQADKQRQARIDMYFSVLSVVCGAQLRWVGFMAKGSNVLAGASDNVRDYFAGAAEDGIKFLADKGISATKDSVAESGKPTPKIRRIPMLFQNDLENILDHYKSETSQKITTAAGSVLKDKRWAIATLAIAGRDLAAAKRQALSEYEHLKNVWLKSCFYYSNQPKNLTHVEDMSRVIEKAFWAEWVLKHITVTKKKMAGPGGAAYRSFTNPEEAILDRLEAIRVIGAADAAERKAQKTAHAIAGVTWRPNHKPPVPNFGYTDDLQDVKRLRAWATRYRPEKLGNVPGLAL